MMATCVATGPQPALRPGCVTRRRIDMKLWNVLLGALFVTALASADDESRASLTKAPMMQSFDD